jgi:hypothetical protein
VRDVRQRSLLEGIGRVVFALPESGLFRYTGFPEDEAGKVHEGFWTAEPA